MLVKMIKSWYNTHGFLWRTGTMEGTEAVYQVSRDKKTCIFYKIE